MEATTPDHSATFPVMRPAPRRPARRPPTRPAVVQWDVLERRNLLSTSAPAASPPGPPVTVARVPAAGTAGPAPEARTDRHVVPSRGTWTAVGPAPELHAWGDMPDSGRVESVAASPTDPATLYVGAAGGGVWKSSDAGRTWAPLTDFQATLNTGSVAIAPSNPDVLYVGTGEGGDAYDAFAGKGVLKSTDGGKTWNLLGQGTFGGAKFYKILVSPTDANTVYAAGANFLQKSTDGGTTWHDIRNGIRDVDGFTDLALSPGDPRTLFVAAGPSYYRYSGDTGNGVYVSHDAGSTWAPAGNFPMGPADGRTALAVAPGNPRVLYASVARVGSDGGGLLAMLRSRDGGRTWHPLGNTPDYLGGQGWYDTSLAVSPANPDVAFAGGQSQFIETTDGGANWTDISVGAGQGQIHPDHHAIAFDAAGRLIDGNDGGVFRLDDPHPARPHWSDLNTNLQITDVQGVALHPTDAGIAYGGGQDNGLLAFNGSGSWQTLQLGDAGKVYVDPLHPATLYRIDGNHFQRSDDRGQTFRDQTNGLPSPNRSLDPAGAITLSAWENAADWNGNRRLLQKGDNDNQYRLLAENGLLKFDLSGVGVVTAPLPGTGAWHLVTGTYDGAGLTLYVDGSPVASAPASGPIDTSGDPLAIGAKPGSSFAGDYFKGLLDDVRIYARALSAGEVRALFTGSPAGQPSPRALAAEYEFEEGRGTTAADASGNHNGGTLVNGAAFAPGRRGGGTALSLDGNFQFVSVGGTEKASAVAFDPGHPGRILLGTTHVYQSSDRGAHFTPLGTAGWTGSDQINHLATSKSSPGTIYATAGAHVFATFDGGATWHTRDVAGAVGADGFNALVVDPKKDSIAYAVTNASGNLPRVFRTADGGRNWSDVTGNLADGSIYDLVLDPRPSGGRLFVATETGVSAAPGPGGTWSPYGRALPHARVWDLELNPLLNLLAAGTQGRGVWEILVPPP